MRSQSTEPTLERETTEALFRTHYGALLRFSLRRTPDAETAADVVAATFLTAWRRRADLPSSERAQLAWLFAVARNQIGTQLRSHRRASALIDRLRGDAHLAPPSLGQESSASPLALAFDRLSASDREVLSLHAWEGLNNEEAARSLGCSANAYAIRLHRSKSRLRAGLATQEPARPSADERTTGPTEPSRNEGGA